jgi:hypothetical protein
VLFVMPLRLSGGTRLKVLERMSMAKAVVSTSVGRKGIDVSHSRHAAIQKLNVSRNYPQVLAVGKDCVDAG